MNRRAGSSTTSGSTFRPSTPRRRTAPGTERTSVTAFLTFIHDPVEFFWRYVRRVPEPPSPAARLGNELHRRIEQHARGAVPLGGSADETEEPYDLDPSERQGGGKAVSAEEMWENFSRSQFAERTPLMVEQPFTLYIGEGISLEGRVELGIACAPREFR